MPPIENRDDLGSRAGTALFLKRWLRRPFAVGAVVPSGRLLAEAMGGGGHPQACGFRMGPERLAELLTGVFWSDPGQAVTP